MSLSNFPVRHVAVVMDGNGRWAKNRLRPRVWGHVRGSNVVKEIVEEARDLGISSLTLYSFSTENWSRPLLEVKTIFHLLKKFIQEETKRILDNNIRFKVIGDISNLPNDVKKLIADLENSTKDFTGLKLTLAIGYGGRLEIVDAINSFMNKYPNEKITEEKFSAELYNPQTGDVDLLIRTGGDCRISNFLLWQLAYAELHFTDTMWPDFSREEFREICLNVAKKERRFGNIGNDKNIKKLSDSIEEAKQNKIRLNEDNDA